jgi:hypothetical protein
MRRAAFITGLLVCGAATQSAELDPRAVVVTLPERIAWVSRPGGGSDAAVLVGDPEKPGLYVELVRWKAHHNSRPHYHPNDRYITVLSGTWWVGSGPEYDPDSMQPVRAGSFVTHFGNGIHYDGAKDEDTVIEIVGIGPVTATAAETHAADRQHSARP